MPVRKTQKNPYQFALISASLITLASYLILLIYSSASVIISLLIFLISFIIIQYRIEGFLFKRVKELYQDLDTFLGFCLQHNKDIIKITGTTKYFDYLKGLPKVEEKKSKTNKYLRNTTRMTCLEMDLF